MPAAPVRGVTAVSPCLFILLLFSLTGLVACGGGDDATGAPVAAPVDAIAFTADQAYPECASWSEKQQVFIVSSMRHGVIGKVTPEGRYTPFISDARIVSSLGVRVDDARNTLWVVNADAGVGDRTAAATQGRLAAVATYNATTGEPKAYVDLGSISEGAHFGNDLTLDADGNAYVTDSYFPAIYRIDPSGQASVFTQSDLFNDGDGFKLNGIAWHEDGYLLVGKYNSGELFRVNLQEPTHIDRVQLPEALIGADGLRLLDTQHLIVVQNSGVDRTIELTSTDGWKSARITRQRKSQMSMPTSATQVGHEVYVLNSRIDTLLDSLAPKVSDYLLQKF